MFPRLSALQPFLTALSLVGLGVAAGVLLTHGASSPVARALHACPCGRQFLVEFRLSDDMKYSTPPDLIGLPIFGRGDVLLEVDGEAIGALSVSRHPARRFFCEGNHTMRIGFSDDSLERKGQKIEHNVEFAVSRPSVFHVTERGADDARGCVSEPWCPVILDLELSKEDPDAKVQSAQAAKE